MLLTSSISAAVWNYCRLPLIAGFLSRAESRQQTCCVCESKKQALSPRHMIIDVRHFSQILRDA